jgi:hypothetical protein
MLFLLLRILPYLTPVVYFFLARAIFLWSDSYQFFLLAIFLLLSLYFLLLKIKSPGKPVLPLGVFALIFAFTGLTFSFSLENNLVINLFLAIWSLVLFIYLEAVFHDFYETYRKHLLNLENIVLYCNLLVIFFLTASLLSWGVFLNFSYWLIFIILPAVYFFLLTLSFKLQKFGLVDSRLKAGVITLILWEILIGFKLLPVSFYVSAAGLSIAYYCLFYLVLSGRHGKLSWKDFLKYAIFSLLLLLIVLLTAVWS